MTIKPINSSLRSKTNLESIARDRLRDAYYAVSDQAVQFPFDTRVLQK